MTLAGTRPILQDELLKYELHHRARIAIKPGITGMWQVSGRSDITDFEEVVRLDTEYISNWNFGLDGQREKEHQKLFQEARTIMEKAERKKKEEYQIINPVKYQRCVNRGMFVNPDNLAFQAALNQDFDKVKKWYDGYLLKDYQVYNPRAVVSVMLKGEYKSYWSETASYEAIVPFINMNYDGLKTAIIEMLSGSSVKVNTATFKNDTVNIQSKDDVLTYMIHLGYLGYDQTEKIAFVPNEEIRQELTNAVKSKSWNEMLMFQQESEILLDATLDMDNETVAAQIEKIHNEYASVIRYHDENSLSSVLAIAYLGTMQYYFKPVREFPTGRGFADFIFIPKPEYKSAYPALVVELKWNQKVQTAIQQIKDRKYPSSISDYTGDILLVGINYDKKSKKHQCIIEKV